MSNFYHELDVETVLQCPVCFELPSDVIFLCKVGHHMCEKCRKRLTTCPTCQSSLTGTRNFLAEALISKFSIFKGAGDGTLNNNGTLKQRTQADSSTHSTVELQDNKSQLRALPLVSGVYQCSLETCRNRKKIASSQLFPHMTKVHAHLFDKFQNKTATFTHNFKDFCMMKGKRKYHRAIHVSNMGIFFLNLEILEDAYLNCWISAPTSISKANRFQYQTEFTKEDDEMKLTFSSKVASNEQEIQWLLQRGLVFIIPPCKHNLTVGQFFSFNLRIVYRPPLPESLPSPSRS